MHVLSGYVLSPTRPSGTVSCPICMDGYSEVRNHVLSSLPFCRGENGAEVSCAALWVMWDATDSWLEGQTLDFRGNLLVTHSPFFGVYVEGETLSKMALRDLWLLYCCSSNVLIPDTPSPTCLVPADQPSWLLYSKYLLWCLFFQIVQSGRLIVSTKCGHVFCSQCLRDSLRNANSCPTCRKKLTHRQYHPIYIWVLLFLRTNSMGFWGKMLCFQCFEDLKSSGLCTHANKTDFFLRITCTYIDSFFNGPSCFLLCPWL